MRFAYCALRAQRPPLSGSFVRQRNGTFTFSTHAHDSGFDNIDFSDIIQPPLTTLHLSRSDLAQAFYTALTDFGKDPHVVGKQYSVTTSMMMRSSTAPPRGWKK